MEESQEQAVNLDLSAAGAAGNLLGAIDQKNEAVVRDRLSALLGWP